MPARTYAPPCTDCVCHRARGLHRVRRCSGGGPSRKNARGNATGAEQQPAGDAAAASILVCRTPRLSAGTTLPKSMTRVCALVLLAALTKHRQPRTQVQAVLRYRTSRRSPPPRETPSAAGFRPPISPNHRCRPRAGAWETQGTGGWQGGGSVMGKCVSLDDSPHHSPCVTPKSQVPTSPRPHRIPSANSRVSSTDDPPPAEWPPPDQAAVTRQLLGQLNGFCPSAPPPSNPWPHPATPSLTCSRTSYRSSRRSCRSRRHSCLRCHSHRCRRGRCQRCQSQQCHCRRGLRMHGTRRVLKTAKKGTEVAAHARGWLLLPGAVDRPTPIDWMPTIH